jgi:uncharacterized protein (TIGR02246 family)
MIRVRVDAFSKAFNAGDSKTIASLFASEAQLIDEDGNTTQGRDAIEKTFAGIFANAPQARMEIDISSIRFLGSALAIETGVTKVTRRPGEAPEVDRYTVVHVKSSSGQWWGLCATHPEPSSPITNGSSRWNG